MGLPLRITYNNNDVLFELLTEKPFAGAGEIEIRLNGDRYKLIRKEREWVSDSEEKALDPGLAHAIGKAMELRYRVWQILPGSCPRHKEAFFCN